jgi:opine dehydrogenase
MRPGAKVAVLGAGNGGFAAAVDLVLRGFAVALFNRSDATLAAVREAGGIRYQGVLGNGSAAVDATTDMQAALAGAALVEICAPATAHGGYAAAMAPHLPTGTPIVLNPGNMLGSVAFVSALRQAGHAGPVTIGETATLTYICRKPDPGSINITASLRDVPFAAYPGKETPRLLPALAQSNLSLMARPDVLTVGLANVNLVLHPPGMILAAAWIEHSGGRFAYYYDAATPGVAAVMGALDRERLAVAAAYGAHAEPFPTLFAAIGSTTDAAARSGSYLQALRESAPNRHIQAPERLNHRYLNEDVPYGLVPMSELGSRAGVPMPVIDSLITLAGVVNGTNYRTAGRRLDAMGFAGCDVAGVIRVLTG